jgi:hypothetical protein
MCGKRPQNFFLASTARITSKLDLARYSCHGGEKEVLRSFSAHKDREKNKQVRPSGQVGEQKFALVRFSTRANFVSNILFQTKCFKQNFFLASMQREKRTKPHFKASWRPII